MVALNFRASTVPAPEFVCVKLHVGAGVAQEASTGGRSFSYLVPSALLAFLPPVSIYSFHWCGRTLNQASQIIYLKTKPTTLFPAKKYPDP